MLIFIVSFTVRNEIKWNIWENFVCKISVILFRPQNVKYVVKLIQFCVYCLCLYCQNKLGIRRSPKHWKDIFIAPVIVIIKSEVSTFPIVIIFFRGRVFEMFVTHFLSRIAYTFRENWDFVLIIIVQFMMSANSQIRYGLQIVFVCLYIIPSHYHCANLSVDIELMKCLPDIFCRVCE